MTTQEPPFVIHPVAPSSTVMLRSTWLRTQTVGPWCTGCPRERGPKAAVPYHGKLRQGSEISQYIDGQGSPWTQEGDLVSPTGESWDVAR